MNPDKASCQSPWKDSRLKTCCGTNVCRVMTSIKISSRDVVNRFTSDIARVLCQRTCFLLEELIVFAQPFLRCQTALDEVQTKMPKLLANLTVYFECYAIDSPFSPWKEYIRKLIAPLEL